MPEKMRIEDDFLIISVESRKGGVGKTTAALNVARVLREAGRRVLFIDADVTGTNATDCIDSYYWREVCHPVKLLSKDKKEPKPANLLDIFNNHFLAGAGVPGFAAEERLFRQEFSFSVAADQVNVLGSHIYQADDGPILEPEVLFDDLHALWFTQFLQQVCCKFASAMQSPIAIVIDNSPGYIGICPSIQEWLTNVGPSQGKFLMVASPDAQDLISCAHAVHDLHGKLKEKFRLARLHTSLSHIPSSDAPLTVKDLNGEFFTSLIEAGMPKGLLLAGDITNLDSLASKLKDPPADDPVSNYLSSQLLVATRNLLLQSTADRGTLRQALADDLNRILQRGALHETEAFANLSLCPEIQTKLAQKTTGQDLVRLNRALLHRAYSNEISEGQIMFPAISGRPPNFYLLPKNVEKCPPPSSYQRTIINRAPKRWAERATIFISELFQKRGRQKSEVGETFSQLISENVSPDDFIISYDEKITWQFLVPGQPSASKTKGSVEDPPEKVPAGLTSLLEGYTGLLHNQERMGLPAVADASAVCRNLQRFWRSLSMASSDGDLFVKDVFSTKWLPYGLLAEFRYTLKAAHFPEVEFRELNAALRLTGTAGNRDTQVFDTFANSFYNFAFSRVVDEADAETLKLFANCLCLLAGLSIRFNSLSTQGLVAIAKTLADVAVFETSLRASSPEMGSPTQFLEAFVNPKRAASIPISNHPFGSDRDMVALTKRVAKCQLRALNLKADTELLLQAIRALASAREAEPIVGVGLGEILRAHFDAGECGVNEAVARMSTFREMAAFTGVLKGILGQWGVLT